MVAWLTTLVHTVDGEPPGVNYQSFTQGVGAGSALARNITDGFECALLSSGTREVIGSFGCLAVLSTYGVTSLFPL